MLETTTSDEGFATVIGGSLDASSDVVTIARDISRSGRLRVAAEAQLAVDDLVSHVVDALAEPMWSMTSPCSRHWTRAMASPAPNEPGAVSASVGLRSSVDAPRAARQFLRDTFATAGLKDVGDVVEVLASEVVTTAVQHVGSSMQLRVIRQPSSIRVEVDGESAYIPQRQTREEEAARPGRGARRITDRDVARPSASCRSRELQAAHGVNAPAACTARRSAVKRRSSRLENTTKRYKRSTRLRARTRAGADDHQSS
jgi:hypothetical protein